MFASLLPIHFLYFLSLSACFFVLFLSSRSCYPNNFCIFTVNFLTTSTSMWLKYSFFFSFFFPSVPFHFCFSRSWRRSVARNEWSRNCGSRNIAWAASGAEPVCPAPTRRRQHRWRRRETETGTDSPPSAPCCQGCPPPWQPRRHGDQASATLFSARPAQVRSKSAIVQ